MISSYIESLRTGSSTTPIVIDENGAISLLSSYYGNQFDSLEDTQTGDYPGLFVYRISSEKQHFDILTVRKCIADMMLEPFSWKNLAVLKDFHTATLDAQNAMLKLLEDCPSYLAIILVVADEESLLDTVRSRVISLYSRSAGFFLDSHIRKKMDLFFSGEVDEFVAYLHDAKYTKEEAVSILHHAITYGDPMYIPIYERGIGELFSTNENPRNILDASFLA